jgi:anti-sigma regulatory factor (Ser/Thr protein kinase)
LSPSILLADGNANFQVLWEDGERVFCRVGSHAKADGSVLPAAEHPTPATLDRLAHEYGLNEELDGAWALRPLELVALTRTEAANNSVSVRTQLAEGLPRLQGDRVQLQQLLLNLIINAIEAMRDVGEEERELLINTRDEPDGVSVEVRDSGLGFARRLLSARSRLSPPRNRTVWGLGCRSAGRLSKRIADDCGRAQTCHVVVSLASLRLLILPPHRAQNPRAEDDCRR